MQQIKLINSTSMANLFIATTATATIMLALPYLYVYFSELTPTAITAGPFYAVGTWLIMMPVIMALAALGAVICFTTTFPFPKDYQTTNNKKPLKLAALTGAALALIFMFSGATDAIKDGYRAARFNRAMAPKVQEFASSNFDTLDLDHNDSITLSELTEVSKTGSAGIGENKIISYMIAHQEELGHLVSKTVWETNGFTWWITSPAVYEINRADLNHYPVFINNKYKHW